MAKKSINSKPHKCSVLNSIQVGYLSARIFEIYYSIPWPMIPISYRTSKLLLYLVLIGATIFHCLLALKVPLWFDEIYGINEIRQWNSPLDAFKNIHNNNHILNSILIYPFRFATNYISYRWQSILAAAIATLFIYRIAIFQKLSQPLIPAILFSLSSFITSYSIEARGYLLSLCICLISYDLWLRNEESPNLWRLTLFSFFAILGILSHAAYLYFLGSLALININRWSQLQKLLPSIAFSILFYFLFLHQSETVGVPPMTVGTALVNFFSYLSGGEALSYFSFKHNIWVYFSAGLSIFLLAFSMFKYPPRETLFFILLTLVLPFLSFVFYDGSKLAPRYLIISIPFYYLLIARLWNTATNSFLIKSLLVLIIALNLIRQISFYQNAEPLFPKVLSELNLQDRPILVGGDLDQRIKLLFDFYHDHLKLENLQYIPNFRDATDGVDFIISHHIDPFYEPIQSLKIHAYNYQLVKSDQLKFNPRFSWYLYEKIE